MKLFFTISITFIVILPIFGQVAYHSTFEEQAFKANDPLQIMIAGDPEATYTKYREIQMELDLLLDKLHSKQAKFNNKEDFLEWAFYYVHRKMLGWYENYVSLNELFEQKKYDCLTGTILYSLILDDLKIPYTIHEFDYHIFLVINLPDRNILIEATDPLDGFIKDHEMIEERVEQYFSSTTTNSDPVGIGQIQKEMHGSQLVKKQIDLQKLAGLQYYNLAIRSYNGGAYSNAVEYINKAELLYPGDRMISTKKLMISAL